MKVVNIRKERYTVYIGRGSIFGNPFKIGKDGTRKEVIEKYEKEVRLHPHILRAIELLSPTAVLGCYCKPKACHGDIIIKLWKEIHNDL
jgi:hypothetical protein